MMKPPHKKSEKSFTLIETLIALGIMVTLVLQMALVQGQAISFSDYGRNMTKAIWLAKGLMSKIEYQSKFIPLKEMKYKQEDGKFEEELCSSEGNVPCEFTHNVEIANWKLDLLDIFFQQKQKGEGEKSEENPMIGMMKEQLKQYLGDELISFARVEVFWPEGSRRNSVDLSLLLADQLALDQLLQTFQPIKKAGKKDGKEGEKPSDKEKDPNNLGDYDPNSDFDDRPGGG